MRRRTYASIGASVFLVLTTSAAGFAALGGASGTSVSFTATGPAGLKIEGKTSDLAVAEAGGNVAITVPLGNLATGISLRDQHMKEKYLEVPKYPAAVLTVSRAALKLPGAGGQVDADVPGSLTLHGQTHPVTVHYTAKGDGSGFAAQGKFHVNMTEYGISVPSYLGVTVKPDVDVSASFHVSGP